MKRLISLCLISALLAATFSGCNQESSMPATDTTAASVTQPAKETSAEEEGVLEGNFIAQEAALLQITEVMPDNRNLVMGSELDWIELYNPGESTVNLDGYALTDDLENPQALPLTGLKIAAEGYLTVVLEDTDAFGLSEAGETLWLIWQTEPVCSVTFGAAQRGASFDAEGNVCQYPTPGFANSQAGYCEYLESLQLPELIISEVMSDNGAYYPYNYGREYCDLVEVCNRSGQPVALKDYYITEEWAGTERYYFPDVMLAPGEMYVVLCSGNAAKGSNHAPFSLSTGETVYLAKNGVYTDALVIPEDLQYNESYGRSGNIPVYLNKPTPGKENTEGNLTGICAPVVDVEPGMYDEAVTVTLSGQGTIYYTTSGTRPTTYSNVYKGPITVTDVTTLRAICVEGSRQSPVANYCYVIGKEHDLPVLVISLPESSIWGERGLHNNIESSYEYEAVMTLIEDGEVKFSVPMGIRLHGNDSRKGSKKNYKLLFKAEYGMSKLEYPLFDNRDIDSFNSLLLKGGSEDWGASMIRDELATSIVDGTTALYTQAKKPVVAYIAGTYWGVNHLRERLDEEYVASHLNVSPESAEILSSSAGYQEAGSGESYHALKRYAKTHDMSTNENYAYLCQQIDVNSLMDWYICRTYYGDTDIANIRRFRSTEGDGKWHWMFFDLDWSFYKMSNPIKGVLDLGGGEKVLMQAILASEAGRDAFLKRFAYLMETILNEEYITAQIDAMVAEIQSEMPADRARWNRTMSGWEKNVQQLRDFTKDRQDTMLKGLKNYFNLTESQMTYYFGSLRK